jgi:O-antigen biosynthesis protein WbqP
MKRVFDFWLAVFLSLILLLPIGIIALFVRWTSPGPALYWSDRVGQHNRIFRMPKFRSMRVETPAVATHLLPDPQACLTPMGAFLRKTSLDELPQLWNILKGDMSFVGPRPERPFFVEQHIADIPGYRERFKVKPGVTGLAQVSGSYATTPERKLKYDLIYLYHQSLLMDVQILVETVRVVLTGRGAR